jgi:multiple sugar transport system substrate-binding protein
MNQPFRKMALVACLVAGASLIEPRAAAAQEETLKVLVPEHWRIVQPLADKDRDSAVPRRLWFYDMVQNFEAKHPDIKLDFEAIPWDHVTSIFTNKTLAGDPPDITFLPNGPQYKLARAGYLHPLDDFDFDWSDYNDNILRENMSVDGHVYLVPNYTIPFVLYYNKALFEEAGIERPPQTWDEMIAAAKKLTRDTDGDGKIDTWGLGLPASSVHPPFVFQTMEVLVWLLGGDVAKDGRATFDSPEVKEAVQLYVDLVYEHEVMPRAAATWDKEYMSLFRNGQIAMTIRGAEEYVPAVDAMGDDVGIARVPPPEAGDPPYTWTEIWGFVMSENAGETKPQAAWAFLEEFAAPETFLLSAEYQKGLPTRRSVAEDEIYRSDPTLTFLADYVVDAGRADPYIEEFEAWADILARTVEGAVLGLGKPDELLSNAQREYDARLSR